MKTNILVKIAFVKLTVLSILLGGLGSRVVQSANLDLQLKLGSMEFESLSPFFFSGLVKYLKESSGVIVWNTKKVFKLQWKWNECKFY